MNNAPGDRGVVTATLIFLCTMVATDVSAASYVVADGGSIRAGNDTIELVFRQSDGNLTTVLDKSRGVDLMPARTSSWNGLIFRYLLAGTSTPGDYLNPASARRFSTRVTEIERGTLLTLIWSDFASAQMPAGAVVSLDVVIPNDGSLTEWTPRIQSTGSPGVLHSLTVPSLNGIQQISENGTSDELVHPTLSGILFKDPVHTFAVGRGIGWEQYYPSGYMNMQFMAYYSRQRSTGLYLAAYDPAGHMKFLNVTRTADEWMGMGIVHVVPWVETSDWTLPYPVIVGVLHGDWYDAAQEYRRWASTQPFTAQGTLAQRTDVPAWIRSTGAMGNVFTRPWVRSTERWNGPFSSLGRVARSFGQMFSVPLTILWNGWERNGPWIESPDFTPPTEGWSSFSAATSSLHAEGGRVWVIPTTSAQSTRIPSWGTAERQATIGPDGRPMFATQSQLDRTGRMTHDIVARMDPSPYWSERIASLGVELAQHGVDMMQMDGNPAEPTLCYAVDHQHASGGGNWWATGLGKVFQTTRNRGRAVNGDWALGAEWHSESLLPYLDGSYEVVHTGINRVMLSSLTTTTNHSYIPLWQTVYHDYTITYAVNAFMVGNDVSFYRHGLAESFAWGEIPHGSFDPPGTFRPWELSGYEQGTFRYLGRMAQMRAGHGRPFLVEGRMLRRPVLDVPRIKVGPATRIPYSLADVPEFDADAVLTSAWRGTAGQVGILLTNISDAPVTLAVPLDAAALELNADVQYRLTEVRNGSARPSVALALPSEVHLDLQPLDIILLIVE